MKELKRFLKILKKERDLYRSIRLYQMIRIKELRKEITEMVDEETKKILSESEK